MLTPHEREYFRRQQLEIVKIMQLANYQRKTTTVEELWDKVKWEYYYIRQVQWLENKLWPPIR
jgi:hypothetical protein